MDSIPSYEFHKIFRRLSYDVDLKGAYTPEDVDERLERAQENFREEAREARSDSEAKRPYKKAKAIENLRDKGKRARANS